LELFSSLICRGNLGWVPCLKCHITTLLTENKAIAFLPQTILTNLGTTLWARLEDIGDLATFRADIAQSFKVAFLKVFTHRTHSQVYTNIICMVSANATLTIIMTTPPLPEE